MTLNDDDENAKIVLQPDAEKALAAARHHKLLHEIPITAARSQQPVQYVASEEDKDRFAAILEETGSVVEARKVLNWSKLGMQRIRAQDPEFDAQCQEAQDRWIATVAKEVHRRAMEGSDKLLELLAKRWIPEFREKFTVDQTGTVQHEHKLAHVLAVRNLTPDQRAAMRILLEGQAPQPALGTGQPGHDHGTGTTLPVLGPGTGVPEPVDEE